jgi:hypothetical protein
MGALTEACYYLADADDPQSARAEVDTLVAQLLSGLRTAGAAAPPPP